MEKRLLWLVSVAAVLFLLPGCGGGPAVYSVAGKVTIGGKPAEGVKISFMPSDPAGIVATGTVGADGTYTVYSLLPEQQTASQGALPGQYKVVLAAATGGQGGFVAPQANPGGEAGSSGATPYNPTGGAASGPPGLQEAPFPKEYLSAESSPKSFEVVAGANECNLEL